MQEASTIRTSSIIKDTERILAEIDEMNLENTDRWDADASLEDFLEQDLRLRQLNQELEAVPGSVEVELSADEMEATITLHPPQGEGQMIAPEQVYDLLHEKGVVTGIDGEKISEALEKCNLDRVLVRDSTVAQGTPASAEVPSHLVLNEQVFESDSAGKQSPQVDYRSISPFIIVSRGQVLATIAQAIPGQMGTTVTGRKVPFESSRVNDIIPGNNTFRSGDTIRAKIDGRLVLNEGTLLISPILEIKSNVDYSTGNIDFPGDVYIHGEVRDRFTIRCAGSLFCRTTLDASRVLVGGDILVSKGIIGRKEGVVKAGGFIQCKFIENCSVEARGDIKVKSAIVNSQVNSLQSILLGAKGTLIGGRTYAQNGLRAFQLGNGSEVPTEVICGMDYTIQHALIKIKEHNIKLATALNKIDRTQADSENPDQSLAELRRTIKARISSLSEQALTLIHRLDRNEEARVIVGGEAYPGVQIEICHSVTVVTRNQKWGEFMLNKSAGRVDFIPNR